MPRTTRPYRAMSDADIDRYLVKLRKRIRDDQRPDPAAMDLPDLDAYVEGLAEAGTRRHRMVAAITPTATAERMTRRGGLW